MKTQLIILVTATLAAIAPLSKAAENVNSKVISATDKPAPGLERAVLGGGCFWCIEAIIERLDGVKDAVSGYAGGHTANPTYEDVCRHTTGHAEVVLVDFDPKVITFEKLLDVFWHAHRGTTWATIIARSFSR